MNSSTLGAEPEPLLNQLFALPTIEAIFIVSELFRLLIDISPFYICSQNFTV